MYAWNNLLSNVTEKMIKQLIESKTYGGVRHFMLVALTMWFKNSFSSSMTVLTATWGSKTYVNT